MYTVRTYLEKIELLLKLITTFRVEYIATLYDKDIGQFRKLVNEFYGLLENFRFTQYEYIYEDVISTEPSSGFIDIFLRSTDEKIKSRELKILLTNRVMTFKSGVIHYHPDFEKTSEYLKFIVQQCDILFTFLKTKIHINYLDNVIITTDNKAKIKPISVDIKNLKISHNGLNRTFKSMSFPAKIYRILKEKKSNEITIAELDSKGISIEQYTLKNCLGNFRKSIKEIYKKDTFVVKRVDSHLIFDDIFQFSD
jgi:hypothetical protein